MSFNSRAREGRDVAAHDGVPAAHVSTHAPARGATRIERISRTRNQSFQLTRPRGARQQLVDVFADAAEFQLTRPRGARLITNHIRQFGHEFQLTRPRGARPLRSSASFPIVGFQLTRPRGARLGDGLAFWRGLLAFQLTRPRGARHTPSEDDEPREEFQLTRPRGARPSQLGGVSYALDVSTHAPARGATPQQPPADRVT